MILLSVVITSVFYIKDYPKIIPILFLTLGFGLIGFLDDYLKVVMKRSDGLYPKQKMALQIVVTAIFAFYMVKYSGVSLAMLIPFSGGKYLDIGWLAIPLMFFVVIGTVNGTNFTDGLDGLASSVTVLVATFFTVVAVGTKSGIEPITCAVVGALLGFLLFNVYPASVFMGLGDGHAGGVAVDGGRGAEHEVLAVVAAHHVQDDQRAVEVIIVVFDGLGHALAHRLISGKLDDGGDVRALGEDLLHVLVLGHVRIVEAEVLAGDLLHAVQHHGGSVIIVICHDHVIAGIQKFDAGVAADIAGTAGNQNCHSPVPLSLITCSLVENNLVFCNREQGVHIVKSTTPALENNIESISRNVNGTAERRGLLYDVRKAGDVCTCDDGDRYWLAANGHVYVWDYVLSSASKPSWFYFTNIRAAAFFLADETVHHLSPSGRVTRMERTYADYNGPIDKVYRFATQHFGSYDRLKDVRRVVFQTRSDTDTKIRITYKSDYETRRDLTDIESFSWRLCPRDLTHRYLGVPQFALAAVRKPGCRHVRHFTMTLENHEAFRDMSLVGAQIYYNYQGRDR